MNFCIPLHPYSNYKYLLLLSDIEAAVTLWFTDDVNQFNKIINHQVKNTFIFVYNQGFTDLQKLQRIFPFYNA